MSPLTIGEALVGAVVALALMAFALLALWDRVNDTRDQLAAVTRDAAIDRALLRDHQRRCRERGDTVDARLSEHDGALDEHDTLIAGLMAQIEGDDGCHVGCGDCWPADCAATVDEFELITSRLADVRADGERRIARDKARRERRAR